MSQDGVHYIYPNIYFERLRLHQFLACCFEIFDVAIWTCAGNARTVAMVNKIFTKAEVEKFKFVWDSSYTNDSNVLRPDGNCNVMLKDLKMVWVHKFPGVYDDSNTVLIDDSPSKSFLNPSFTTIFPTPFKFGDCSDTFLPDILWPLLRKLACATDVRRFLQINMPKWSTKNLLLDEKNNAEMYQSLRRKFTVTKPLIPTYTILDVSDYEITSHEKYIISKIPAKYHYTCTEKNIREIALRLLGRSYEGPYLNDPIKFVDMIRDIRKISGRFDFTTPFSECTRDTKVDDDRKKLTCSNMQCKLCKL